MVLLIIFAFLAGVVTILSPCILPILPVILSSSVDSSKKRRPFGVIVGFVGSFTFFTLFLSILVRLSGVPADSLRTVSVVILAVFGLTLLIPKARQMIEGLFSALARFAPRGKQHTVFLGGLVIGFSLGLLWTPCVGPILASVISLALTGTVTAQAVAITFVYSLGTAIPMFAIMQTGSSALQKVPWLVARTPAIQKAFGVLMMVTALAIFFNIDRQFQTWVLQTFPQYGIGLTKFEDNIHVKQELKKLTKQPMDETIIGKSLSNVTQPKGIPAPELIPGGEWFNTTPFTLRSLRGKVVVIDFWTYSCINCQRTLPYLRSWWEKYKDKGLVIIGAHAPEFEFEKDRDNVAQAISDFKLKYPIMQDNDFATWRAYDNHYWPAKYFIDKDGFIRYSHFGEGAYDESEKVIQQLLAETGISTSASKIANPFYQIYAKTPEIYVGYSRIDYIVSPEQIAEGVKATYTMPSTIPVHTFAYEGGWTIMSEYASPTQGARLYLNFEAKEVFLVARPKNGSSKFSVYLDGKAQAF